jgi:hypothetical protein
MVQQEHVHPMERTLDLAAIGAKFSDDLAIEVVIFRRTGLCHDV